MISPILTYRTDDLRYFVTCIFLEKRPLHLLLICGSLDKNEKYFRTPRKTDMYVRDPTDI